MSAASAVAASAVAASAVTASAVTASAVTASAVTASAVVVGAGAALVGCGAATPTLPATQAGSLDATRGDTEMSSSADAPFAAAEPRPKPSGAAASKAAPLVPAELVAPNDRNTNPPRADNAGLASPDGLTSNSSRAPSRTQPVDPELSRLLALGDGALRREDYPAAVDAFRRARRHAPSSARAVAGLVAARFGQLAIPTEYKGAVGNRNVTELLALLDTAAPGDADAGVVHLQRARLLVVLGRSKEARASLDEALAFLPNDAEVHSLLAIVELSEGHVSEALAGFSRASELEPHSAERLSNWGTALLMHRDIQQAISVYRRAVSLAPHDARARGDLGTALLAIHDIGQAMPHLERACELAPGKATFMNNLGYAYQLQGDWTRSKHWYDRALAADPQLGSAWINLGTWYAAQQRYDAAERAFRKALALNPDDPRALGNLDDLASLRVPESRHLRPAAKHE